ncbi:MAG: hypothetical protein H0X46_07215, partial [Bacteroidetes bacterium]|nr:hypothetical protein [Bacteroidota bacterium]
MPVAVKKSKNGNTSNHVEVLEVPMPSKRAKSSKNVGSAKDKVVSKNGTSHKGKNVIKELGDNS